MIGECGEHFGGGIERDLKGDCSTQAVYVTKQGIMHHLSALIMHRV